MASLQEQRFGKADMRQSKEIVSPRPVAVHGCQLNKGTWQGLAGAQHPWRRGARLRLVV
jgi:hypothetical protein